MVFQNKAILRDRNAESTVASPILSRIVSGFKVPVKQLIFSDDSYSQLMAVFTDGNVKIFALNQASFKKVDNCKYAKKEQLAARTIIEIDEKITLNYSY